MQYAVRLALRALHRQWLFALIITPFFCQACATDRGFLAIHPIRSRSRCWCHANCHRRDGASLSKKKRERTMPRQERIMPLWDVSCSVSLAPGSRLLPYPAGVNVRMCHNNSSTLENAIDERERTRSSCSRSLPSPLCTTRFLSLYFLAAICPVLLASFGLQILEGLRRALWTSDYYLKYSPNHWGTSTCITVHILSKVPSAYPDS